MVDELETISNAKSIRKGFAIPRFKQSDDTTALLVELSARHMRRHFPFRIQRVAAET